MAVLIADGTVEAINIPEGTLFASGSSLGGGNLLFQTSFDGIHYITDPNGTFTTLPVQKLFVFGGRYLRVKLEGSTNPNVDIYLAQIK
jgi:hypothetical protein